MTTYTNVFGGTVVYPAEVSYRAVSLTADTELSWPTELATDTNVASKIMNVTATAGPWDLIMPAANSASVGETVLIFNVGLNAFVVTDNGGNTIVSISPGLAYQLFLTNNSTVNGVWSQVQYGAGTSSATAGSLAGLGIKAIGTSLNQSMTISTISVDYSFTVATDRSGAFVWTGGAGTLTLPLASDAGNDWFVHVRNNGTGAITLTPSGSDLINGSPTLIFNPDDSAIIACSGTGWYSIGFGQAAEFTFDYDSIDLTGESTPYTLSGGNLNRIAYSFGGAIASNFNIIVPSTIQQYWVTNNTTGGFSLVVKTAAGTGITIANGESAILYCNGTNVVDADTSGVAYPISVANGGTGATNATDARTNLSAAKTGINGDITQLAGLSDGGASGPAVTFLSESNTGMYRSAAGALSFSVLGTLEATLTASGLTLANQLTVPNGGTGITTATSNGVIYGNGTSAFGVTAAGTTGQVLVGNTGGAPSWATLTGIGVTSLSGGTTGLTPAVATTGAITLAGTLNVANGGTGATSLTSGYLVKGNGTAAASASVVYDDGTNVGIGTATPGGKFAVASGSSAGTSISTWANYSVFGPNAGSSTGAAVGVSYNTGSDVAEIAAIAPGVAWKPINILSDSFRVTTNNAERLRVDNAGNLGIGTSSPGYKLDVNGAATTMARFTGPEYSQVRFVGGTQACYIQNWNSVSRLSTSGATPLTFGTDDTERARLDASGNLGIGTSSPSSFTGYTSLTVSHPTNGGLIEATNGTSTLRMQTQAAGNPLFGTTTSHNLEVMTAGVTRVTLDTSGNLGLGVTPSAWDSILRPFETYNGVFLAAQTNATANLFLGANAYYGGGSWKYKVTGQKATHYNQLDGTHAWYTAPSGTAGNAISFTQAMTLDAGGRLGIGTSSMLYSLEVDTTSTRAFRITGPDNVRSELTDGTTTLRQQISGDAAIGTVGAQALVLRTSDTERARIDSSGNLLVGTTSSGYGGLVVAVKNGGDVIYSAQTAAGGYCYKSNAANNAGTYYHMEFQENGTARGTITSNGSAVAYNTTSDARLKENIADADSASNLIDQIKVRKYDWKSDGSHQRYGFIAQELLPVAPEAVSQPEDPDQMMGVDYSKLVPMLVKEIQDLRARVAQLEGAA